MKVTLTERIIKLETEMIWVKKAVTFLIVIELGIEGAKQFLI